MDNNQDNPTKILKSWVELYSDSLYSWALYKTSWKETAEDLVQETFLAAFKSYESFKAESNAKTWLFAILNNKIKDYYRKRFQSAAFGAQAQNENTHSDTFFDSNEDWRKEQKPYEWSEQEGNLLDNTEFNTVLQDCMGALPEQWFAAVHYKYLEERKGDVICQELNISPTNFWQILHRAKLQLRKCLELNWSN